MKNTVITARRKKIELLTLLACFIIGNLANLYAIISYKTPFSEMLTSIFYCPGIFVCCFMPFGPIAAFILWNKKSAP